VAALASAFPEMWPVNTCCAGVRADRSVWLEGSVEISGSLDAEKSMKKIEIANNRSNELGPQNGTCDGMK